MGRHGNRYITAQHILDQSDRSVESDYAGENSVSRKKYLQRRYRNTEYGQIRSDQVIKGCNLWILFTVIYVFFFFLKSLGLLLDDAAMIYNYK